MKIIFSESTQTYRIMPQNYWAASIKDNKLTFDSWDGYTKQLLKNPLIRGCIVLTHLLKLIKG